MIETPKQIAELVRRAREFDGALSEASWQVFERLREQVQTHGPAPVHIDILNDEDEGLTWPRTYAMLPMIRNGQHVGWYCDGCGYEQLACAGGGATPPAKKRGTA